VHLFSTTATILLTLGKLNLPSLMLLNREQINDRSLSALQKKYNQMVISYSFKRFMCSI